MGERSSTEGRRRKAKLFKRGYWRYTGDHDHVKKLDLHCNFSVDVVVISVKFDSTTPCDGTENYVITSELQRFTATYTAFRAYRVISKL